MKLPVLLLLSLLIATTLAAAQTLDLLAPPHTWQANVDNPAGTKMTLQPTAEAPLATSIVSDGGTEDYPKLRLEWKDPQDLTRYTRLRLRVKVTSTDPSIHQRRLCIVFYDNGKRHEEMEGHPMWQQSLSHTVPVGKWVEYSDWLTTIQRTGILQVDLYLYEDAAGPLTQTWEFGKAQLEGVGEVAQVFDGEVYPKAALHGAAGAPVGKVGTSDGLQLELGKQGGIAALRNGKLTLGLGDKQPTGLMVRDVSTDDPPVMCGGTISKRGDTLAQAAKLDKLGLAVQATYRSAGPYLEVAGKLSDLTGKDRAVTLYLALPVGASARDWQWWDSAAQSRTKAPEGELSYLEPGMNYGLRGEHSKYPLGTISDPTRDGLTLAVRMDEPVVHRIGYNPALKTLFLAMDFGLVPQKNLAGQALSEAPFRFLIYHSDPAWGMRAALQRYYDFFPGFFTNRVSRQGGWYVWGDARDTKQVLAAGFGAHWGPAEKAVKWDNENGLLALLYIEPELYQQTMGDYQTIPSAEVGLQRLRKLAAGDPEELAKFDKLGYAHSYVPARWVKAHAPREDMQVIARAALNSDTYGADGRPELSGGKFPWMSESQLGFMFPCNLDPDIPWGKGWFARNVYIESGLQGMLESGAHYDGIGLDSFGGFGNFARANYRRDHFQYTNTPLTFSAMDHVPVLAMPYSSVEFARALAKDMHARKLVLMANCSWGTTPGWLTFVAPYLDIFGAEAKQFADPDFIRAIARGKLCTDLPYDPVPDFQLQRNQLWGIFPGHGNKPEYMAQFAQNFRDLAAAGWEPVTYATAAPATVRVERYGRYLVLHNPAKEAVRAEVTADLKALKLKSLSAARVPDGAAIAVEGAKLVVPLEAQGTVVLKLL